MKVAGTTALAGNLSVGLTNGFTLGNDTLRFGIVQAVGGFSGAFANYAEGATIMNNGRYSLKITYLGSVSDTTVSKTGGHDVVLYYDVPSKATAILFR